MDRRQTRGLIALFAVLNIFCWYVFTRPTSLWLAEQGLQSEAPPPPDIVLTQGFSRAVSTGRDVLHFNFSEAIYPEAEIEELVVQALFEFVPPLEGMWTAVSPDRVRFDLAEPLPPARSWTAKLVKSTSVDGRSITVPVPIEFQSTSPNVWGVHLDHMTNEDVHLEIRFNQPIPGAELNDRIKVTSLFDNSPLPVNMKMTKPQQNHVISVPLPESGDLRVKVEAGYLGTLGPIAAQQAYASTVKIPEGLQCLDASFRGRLTEGMRMVVRFSGFLEPDQPLDLLQIEPEVELTSKRIEDGRIVLRGAFEPGREYEVTLPETLVDQWDRVLGESPSRVATMPEWSPELSIVHGGGILSPNGRLEVDVRTVNVQQLRWEVQRLYPNNVVPFLNGSWYRKWDSTSRTVTKGILQCEGPRNELLDHVLPLREHLENPIGIHRIELADNDQNSWHRTSAMISITDLGLLYKAERDHHAVLIHSIASAQPLPQVRVELRSDKNQVLTEGFTDQNGWVRLPKMPDHPDGSGFVLIAEHGPDLQFMKLSSAAWSAPDPLAGERSYVEEYECFLYPERSMYRPGEPMHVTGVVRDREGGVPPSMPLELLRYGADGKLLRTIPVSGFNEQGIFQIDIATDALDPTGQERHELRIPGVKKPIGSARPFVEAFEPVRLKLESSVPPLVEKGTLDVAVKVSTLFGGVAADLPVRARGQFNPKSYTSTRFPNHRFNLVTDTRERQKLQSKPTVSDDQGTAFPSLTLDAGWGYGEIQLSVSATQIGGRTVSDNLSTIFDPIGKQLGLRRMRSTVPLNSSVEFDWVALDAKDQNRLTSEPSITLQRVQRDWGRRLIRDNWRWTETIRYEDAQNGASVVANDATDPEQTRSSGSFAVSFQEPGEWRVLIESEGQQIAHTVYISTRDGRSQTPNPLVVELLPARETVGAGETIPVVVKAPSSGQLVLTVESDKVDWSQSVAMAGTETTVDIPVPEHARGSVHVLAALIRPLDQNADSWTPRRAKGHVRIPVRAKPPLEPAFTVPDNIEPEQEVTVQIDCPDAPAGTKLHVWAIDEGIVRLSGSEVPNPSRFFHAPRRLGVRTADQYDQLLPDHDRGEQTLRIGSDLEGNSSRRRSPISIDRKSIVLWREMVTLGEDGSSSMTFTMPRLNGALRFRTVVVHDDLYGATEQSVPVVAPVGIDATWPRAVAPGDEFRVPLRIHNRTEVAQDITWTFKGGEGLSPAVRSGVVTVGAGATERRSLPVIANTSGVQRGTLVVESGELGSTTDWTTTVRPATGLHLVDRTIRVSADEPATITMDEIFYSDGLRVHVEAGGPPTLSLRSSLERMLKYPYGCIEQTSSILGSTLLLPQLAATEGREEQVGVDRLVQAGISRMQRMQNSSGAFAYWHGGRNDHVYGTGRAALILAEADALGYVIPETMKEQLLAWLRTEVLGRRQPDANMRALLAHAASVWGIPAEGANVLLFEWRNKLSITGKMHLLAALINLGQLEQANQLFDELDIEAIVAQTQAAKVGTWIETKTLALSMLLEHMIDLRPSDQRMLLVVQAVRKARTNGWWGTTLDTVAATSALIKWMGIQSPCDFTGVVTTGNEQITFTDESPCRVIREDQSSPIQVNLQGTGHATLRVRAEGRPKPGVVQGEEHRGLLVTRKWTTPDGEPLPDGPIRVGDLIYVEVTLETMNGSSRVPYVALTDILPGGMEVEHPRLATSTQFSKPVGAQAERVEFLDDRVLIFATAYSSERTFRYALRAVTAGEFVHPAIEASSMYAPELRSRGPERKCMIVE